MSITKNRGTYSEHYVCYRKDADARFVREKWHERTPTEDPVLYLLTRA